MAPNKPRSSTMAGRARPGARQPRQRDGKRAEQRSDDDRAEARRERKLRGSRAARLQDEDRPGEAEQAHPEVAPQAKLVEQAERLRHRLGERARHLGVAVAGDGDECFGGRRGVCAVTPRRLPTPALPGQVQTVGGAGHDGQPPSQPGQPELPWDSALMLPAGAGFYSGWYRPNRTEMPNEDVIGH